MINYMGFGTAATREESQQKRNKEEADIQAEQYEALKNGPEGKLRTAVGGQYLRDYQRNLDFQRQTGLGTESFRNGFAGGANDAGFTTEQAMASASGILGANGVPHVQRSAMLP